MSQKNAKLQNSNRRCGLAHSTMNLRLTPTSMPTDHIHIIRYYHTLATEIKARSIFFCLQ
jgi:hypothetical protein